VHKSLLSALSLSSLLFTACASVGDLDQAILVRSAPSGAEVTHDGKVLGHTPLLTRIPRQHSNELTLKLNDEEVKHPLKTRYRWGRSFGGNWALLSFAPVGWITDFVTGAAWNYRPEFTVEGFKSTSPGLKGPDSAIAIAPPLSVHPNISDEVGNQLTPKLREYLKSENAPHVLSYESTLNIFNDYAWDYDNAGSRSESYEVYSKTGANKIFFSKIDTASDPNNVLVQGEVRDILDPSTNRKINLTVDKALVPAIHDVGWSTRKENIVTLLPNSVYLDFSTSRTKLEINEEEVNASPRDTDGLLGQVYRYLSAVSFRNVTPPSKRPEWRYQFHLSPSASFSYAKEEFENYAPLANIDFQRTHIDIGWGPNFNYGNNHWNLFFNIFPLVNYDSVSATHNGKDYRAEDYGLKLGIELGVTYFFTQRFSLKFASRAANINTEMWESVIYDITGNETKIESASFATTGLSIGYTFPNKDLPF